MASARCTCPECGSRLSQELRSPKVAFQSTRGPDWTCAACGYRKPGFELKLDQGASQEMTADVKRMVEAAIKQVNERGLRLDSVMRQDAGRWSAAILWLDAPARELQFRVPEGAQSPEIEKTVSEKLRAELQSWKKLIE